MYFFGPYVWLMIPGILLGLYAQFKLSSMYNTYSQVESESGLSGAQAARKILDSAGLANMPIQEIEGHLTDHFDPAKKALFLSADNYEGRSLAAIGVAAHEAGHALQQQAAYALFNLRMVIAPATQIASSVCYGILFFGVLLGGAFASKILLLAIVLYAVITFFQIVTLPVELDASRRAKQQLLKLGLVRPEESGAVSSVLSAAALTYVAGMLSALLVLLRLLMIFNRNDRN